jgi:fermentation-respiration switch protein FrsA (DUF1100 family)
VHWTLLIVVIVIALYILICAMFYLSQEGLIFISKKYGNKLRYKLAVPYEEVFLDTPQGGIINGIILKRENTKGVILYLHGNTGGLNRWCYMAEELTHFGFDVFAIDYRGFGKSKGARAEDIMHSDVEVCWDFIRKRYPDGQKIIWGRSLGSGFAVPLAAKFNPDKLVLETPFDSLLDVAQRQFPFLPNKLLLRYPFRSDLHARDLTCPIIMIHGTKDIIVPYRSALKFFNRVKHSGKAELVTVVGAKHNNLNAYPLFHDKLIEFLA